MCFSAEASFTVGTMLGVVGVATLQRVKKKEYLLIALFPLLFATQQILEGVVWLHMDPTFQSTPFSQLAVNLYLFFAWLFWPIFVPLAFLIAEKENWKKWMFAGAFLIGLSITYVDIIHLMKHQVTPSIAGHSLNYGFTPMYGNIIYGFSAFIPIFLSSIPQMKKFGAVLLATFFISQIIYLYAFTSVWCFFCAASSILLYKILKEASSEREFIKS